MYAVLQTGGKSYCVEVGKVYHFEKLAGEQGDQITFDQILMVRSNGDQTVVGAPYVNKATVVADVLEQTRGEKIRIIKHKRRKHHMKRMGHRQYLTCVRIADITLDGKTIVEAKAEKPAAKKATKAATADKPAAKKTAAKSTAASKPAATKAKKATPAKATEAKKATAAKKTTASKKKDDAK